ncbi:AAA family ATPase [Sporosarcina sp. 179-K 3D1 HS]|uniref:ATP-binding protein n=1 Tax=Sporosarcina sp. 179-K 3D1 HS TaxID=3232169 RepID=UPI0039A19055
MRIEKLVIYGFGKHENVTIDFGSSMNVLYGLNEAGKTTIQQFILHILFGFPPKNSSLLRYEPKSGSTYGGQVQLQDELYGNCTVERIRGKSAGDVTVRFGDGTAGGEEKLKELLRHYDRSSFESIFSFSLLQLQGFEKMDEDELSRTLLASGTTGVDVLLQVEKKLDKEMGDLFKKAGKLPEMNVKIEELRNLESELKAERERAASYAPSMERLQEIDRLLVEWRQQDRLLQEEEEQLALVRQLQPLVEKKQALELQLSAKSGLHFPVDGVRRYEMAAGKLAESKAVTQRLEEELAHIESQMSRKMDAGTLPHLERLLAQESEWHGWQAALGALIEENRQLEGAKRRLLDRLGIDEVGEQILLQADVSLQREDEMADWLRQLDDYDKRINAVHHSLEQLNREWHDLQNELHRHEQQAPSVNDLEMAAQWPAIRQRLAEARAYLSMGTGQGKSNEKLAFSALLAIAVLCVVYGFMQSQWIIIGIGILVGGMGAFFYLQNGASSDVEKTKEMENLVAAYDGQERHFEELEEKVRSFHRQKEALQEALEKLEQKLQALEAEMAELQSRKHQVSEGLAKFLRAYGISGMPSLAIIPELFRMSREFQEVARQFEENENHMMMLNRKISGRIEEAEILIRKPMQPERLYDLLRSEYIRIKREADQWTAMVESADEQKAKLQDYRNLVKTYENQIELLFSEAEATTEEQFYKAHDTYQETILLNRQLEDVLAQIAVYGEMKMPEMISDALWEEQIASIESKRIAITEERDRLVDEKAALLHKTEQLLTDDTLAQTHQLFEIKRSELAVLAKKWSERKAVTEAIRRTMSELKEKKLPAVLRIADGLFQQFTNDNYKSLHVTETGHFQAVATDGTHYPIVELSQATKEQAYIALRFALADSMQDSAPFPLILDDPFVHFDVDRQSSMITVLEEMQKKHQIIYFTCQAEMMDKWQDATNLNVSELGSVKGAVVF